MNRLFTLNISQANNIKDERKSRYSFRATTLQNRNTLVKISLWPTSLKL